MMDLYLCYPDSSMTKLAVVDDYKSLVWADRYYEFGDCELYIKATKENLDQFQIGRLLKRSDREYPICRIQSIELETDEENGDFLIIKAYDLRHVLSQRIVWNQTNYDGTLEGYIRKLVTENVTTPTDTARRMSWFEYMPVTNIAQEQITQQVTYDNVGEKVIELCRAYGYGSQAIHTTSPNGFVFRLYAGDDRSYAQAGNPYVVFSHDFDNIKTTNYKMDYSQMKNVALVGGEGEGASRKRTTVGDASGWDRYEMFVDAGSMSTDAPISQATYMRMLEDKGREELELNKPTIGFEGEVEPNNTYKFGVDYDLGDIVQVKNEYGITARARITEVIESFDENGYTIIPSFEYMEG